MPKEAQIVKRTLERLRQIPKSFWFKTHGGPFQTAGLPDIFGFIDGKPYAFEAKQPGNKPTEIQLHRMEELRRAGVTVGVIFSPEDAFQLIG